LPGSAEEKFSTIVEVNVTYMAAIQSFGSDRAPGQWAAGALS
jgi:hypothetical protein